MQILNGHWTAILCAQKWENCAEFFFTQNVLLTQENCVLGQKLCGFTNLSKLHSATSQFSGGTAQFMAHCRILKHGNTL